MPPSRDDWWGKEAGSKAATVAAVHEPKVKERIPTLRELKAKSKADIEKLPEYQQMLKFLRQLDDGTCENNPSGSTVEGDLASVNLSEDDALTIIEAVKTINLNSDYSFIDQF